MHEAKIVEGSVEVTSLHGLAFTVRCCGDEKSDHRVHIQDAGHLDETELQMKIEQHLQRHGEQHIRIRNISAHAERLAAKGHSVCCGREEDAQ
jgi:hypothetical protein